MWRAIKSMQDALFKGQLHMRCFRCDACRMTLSEDSEIAELNITVINQLPGAGSSGSGRTYHLCPACLLALINWFGQPRPAD
jgi:hypothetical protein